MIDPVRAVAAVVRRTGSVPATARLVVAGALVVAVLATALPGWNVPDVGLLVAVVAGMIWAGAPDSGAGLVCVVVLALCWLTSAPGGLTPGAVVTALALLVAHVAAALAAAMPLTASADRAVALRWARPTASIAAVVIAAAGLLAVLDAWSPPGSVVITLGALALVATGAWRWSPDDTTS